MDAIPRAMPCTTVLIAHEEHLWVGDEGDTFRCYGRAEEQLPPSQPLTVGSELADWWRDQAKAEIKMVVAKAVEYGATDLEDLGHQIARLNDRIVSDSEAAEIGIGFYACGKISRIMAAIKEGRRPSPDTWLDLGVYARMAQRVIESGGWP